MVRGSESSDGLWSSGREYTPWRSWTSESSRRRSEVAERYVRSEAAHSESVLGMLKYG